MFIHVPWKFTTYEQKSRILYMYIHVPWKSTTYKQHHYRDLPAVHQWYCNKPYVHWPTYYEAFELNLILDIGNSFLQYSIVSLSHSFVFLSKRWCILFIFSFERLTYSSPVRCSLPGWLPNFRLHGRRNSLSKTMQVGFWASTNNGRNDGLLMVLFMCSIMPSDCGYSGVVFEQKKINRLIIPRIDQE